MCIRGKQDGSILDFNTLKTLGFVNEISNDTIILTGGEPTLYSNLLEITEFFSTRAKNVVITTNGTIDINLSAYSHINNLQFQVSIDGDSFVHDNIRGAGTFQKSFTFIKALDKLDFKYSISTVAGRGNIDSFPNLIKDLSTLEKMLYWKVSYEMPFETKNYGSMLSASEWNSFVNQLISIVPFRLKIQKLFPLELYDKNYEKLCMTMEHRFFNCGGVRDKVYIYPDFTVYPCTCLTDFPLGNLKGQALSEILSSEKSKTFSNYKVDDLSICQKCKYKTFCNGGCIGMSYHYWGQLGKGDIRCPLVSHK